MLQTAFIGSSEKPSVKRVSQEGLRPAPQSQRRNLAGPEDIVSIQRCMIYHEQNKVYSELQIIDLTG
jgi:hypothetical protein